MKYIILFLGFLFVLIGALLIASPDVIYIWAEDQLGDWSFYLTVIGFRSVLGILLLLAAKESKYPGVIKFFGYLTILAAIIFILIGHSNFQNFMGSIIPELRPLAPVSGLTGIAFGGFLIYAFSGKP